MSKKTVKYKEEYAAIIAEVEKQHLTIRQLAIKADIVPSDLYSALNGQKPFWPGWRSRVAEVLGVSEEKLFADVDKEGR